MICQGGLALCSGKAPEPVTSEPSTRHPGGAAILGWPVGAPCGQLAPFCPPQGTDDQGSLLAVVSFSVLCPENPGLPAPSLELWGSFLLLSGSEGLLAAIPHPCLISQEPLSVLAWCPAVHLA